MVLILSLLYFIWLNNFPRENNYVAFSKTPYDMTFFLDEYGRSPHVRRDASWASVMR